MILEKIDPPNALFDPNKHIEFKLSIKNAGTSPALHAVNIAACIQAASGPKGDEYAFKTFRDELSVRRNDPALKATKDVSIGEAFYLTAACKQLSSTEWDLVKSKDMPIYVMMIVKWSDEGGSYEREYCRFF